MADNVNPDDPNAPLAEGEVPEISEEQRSRMTYKKLIRRKRRKEREAAGERLAGLRIGVGTGAVDHDDAGEAGGGGEKLGAVAHRLAGQAKIALRQIAKPAMHQFRGPGRGSAGEIARLDQRGPQAGAGAFEGDPRPGHAAADDERVERGRAAQPGQTLRPAHRGGFGSRSPESSAPVGSKKSTIAVSARTPSSPFSVASQRA